MRIEKLFIYPVKSLAGISVESARVKEQGFEGDRQWMIVDSDFNFLTQRQNAHLAVIKTAINSNTLTLSSAEMGSIDVQLSNTEKNVRVWKSHCKAQLATQHTNAWLSEAAKSKKALSLVKFSTAFPRAIDSERFGPGTTYFADGAPYLIANAESLQALNDRLAINEKPAAQIEQFRPNIVISGLDAFAEHTSQKISTSEGVCFRLCDHCQRCAIITIDPHTGDKLGKQSAFKTLAEINPMPNNPKAPAFGVNSVVTQGFGKTLKIKETLSINEFYES